MFLELSHHLSADTPVPPGVPPIEFLHHYSMGRGDVSNLFVLHFSNHTGTHIDAPWHFVNSGIPIGKFSLEEFVFDRPLCLDLALGDGEMFHAAHFQPHAAEISRCDLLLLRTGYARVRRSDPARYRIFAPGMSEEGAHYLAEEFPRLRALGLDTVSLACMQHLEEGLEAHRVLLQGEGRRFLIIEDMNLDHDLSRLRRVIALPLMIDGIDSAPCTVMGIAE
jgi:kynurenine formamidase